MRLTELLDLLAPLHARLIGIDKQDIDQVSFSAIGLHSRKMVPGALFLAIPGNAQDGGIFAKEAVQRGACVVVAEENLLDVNVPQILVSNVRAAAADIAAAWHRYPAQQMECVGITGTNGKTTTSYLLRSMLEESGRKTGLLGTLGYSLLDRTVPAENTTPDAISLQSLLADLQKHGADSSVIEVSSHALKQSRVRGIPFRVGVFTNLSQEHLDYHKTMENYLQAKAMLFTGLAPQATAILNFDDASSMHLQEKTRARVVSYAVERKDVTLSAAMHESTLLGTKLLLKTPEGTIPVCMTLPGKHNVANFLAAAGAARALGVSLQNIARGAEKVRAIPGRLERVYSRQPYAVFVDYAHTDDALEKVLRYLRPLTQERLILVFGCGGDRDRQKRPRMGRVATELADYAILTSDNPRTEDPLSILGEILVGIRAPAGRYAVEPDRKKAIRLAIEIAGNGDVVLIAGKGHETYQIIGKEILTFDDREIAREVLCGTN